MTTPSSRRCRMPWSARYSSCILLGLVSPTSGTARPRPGSAAGRGGGVDVLVPQGGGVAPDRVGERRRPAQLAEDGVEPEEPVDRQCGVRDGCGRRPEQPLELGVAHPELAGSGPEDAGGPGGDDQG